MGVTFGITFISFLSTIVCLLEEDGVKVLKDDETWRIAFGACIVVGVVSTLIIMIFFNIPSLKDFVK